MIFAFGFAQPKQSQILFAVDIFTGFTEIFEKYPVYSLISTFINGQGFFKMNHDHVFIYPLADRISNNLIVCFKKTADKFRLKQIPVLQQASDRPVLPAKRLLRFFSPGFNGEPMLLELLNPDNILL